MENNFINFHLKNQLTNPDGQTGILVLPFTSALTKDMDNFTAGQLSRAIVSAGIKNEQGNFLEIITPQNTKWHAILLYGSEKNTKDKSKKSTSQLSLELGAKIHDHAVALAKKFLKEDKKKKLPLTWVVDKNTFSLSDTAQMVLGYKLKQWQFHHYLTDEKKQEHYPFDHKQIIGEGLFGDESAIQQQQINISAVYDGVVFTRTLISEPANKLNPPTFAKKLQELKSFGLKVTTLNEKDLTKEQMHALLAVGQGSSQESHLVVMEWQGGKNPPIAFVGKGVCFDTGGISLKPSGGMEDMIYDMGGAGTVSGLMMTLAKRKAPINVIGVVALVENMPDGNAQRPGDIVTSMSGQTIEVLNTDAEGRLILADALWYVQKHYQPATIIDLATLTGAMVIALGQDRAGVFSNSDDLAKSLFTAGEMVDEKLWQMPLSPIGGYYDTLIDCFEKRADMKNIGASGQAGSITAAQFLQRFIMAKDDYKPQWAHIDIAGMAWHKKTGICYQAGATGYGVRLLNEWLTQQQDN